MARCSCGNATCSCIVKPVPDGGITVVGNGSSARPYLLGLSSGGNPLDNFIADTTPSLTLQALGAGTPSDKMHLSGIATQALTELRDVTDPNPLQIGDVPVWKGTHWEFEAQTGGSGGGGAIAATPVFAAYSRKAALSFVVSTQTPVPWDTVENAAAGITFNGTTDFTVQYAGTYLITCALTFTAAVNTGYSQVRIIKNGVLYDYNAIPSDDVIGYPVVISRQMKLAIGDVIQIAAYCNPAGTLQVTPTYATNALQIVRTDATSSSVQTSGSIMGDGSSGNKVRPGYTTEIPNAIDLNTYTTPGDYAQTTSAEAAAGTNYPTPAIAGLLEVFANGSSMVWQRYTGYGGNIGGGGYIWERGLYNSVWSAWQIIGGDPALPAPIDTYVSADQTIIGTVRPTESPTQVRATMVNPHPTRRMLVEIFSQGWVQVTGATATVGIYYEYLTVSGSISPAQPAYASRDDSNVGAVSGATFYKAMFGKGVGWIAAGATAVLGVAITRGSGAGTFVARYNHLTITPIRYE